MFFLTKSACFIILMIIPPNILILVFVTSSCFCSIYAQFIAKQGIQTSNLRLNFNIIRLKLRVKSLKFQHVHSFWIMNYNCETCSKAVSCPNSQYKKRLKMKALRPTDQKMNFYDLLKAVLVDKGFTSGKSSVSCDHGASYDPFLYVTQIVLWQ